MIRSRLNIAAVLTAASFRDQETLSPADCFAPLPTPIYIRGTRPPPTADETDTESEQEQEDGADTEAITRFDR